MSDRAPLDVLHTGLDQVTTLLGAVAPEDLGRATPCSDWSVSDLVDHLVQTPHKFARMVRGEDVDWTAPTPHEADPVAAYRRHADELRAALADAPDAPPDLTGSAPSSPCTPGTSPLRWTGRLTDLDPDVAERGLAFMQASLNDDNRAPAFDPEQPAPPDADAYTRIAAFAGRKV